MLLVLYNRMTHYFILHVSMCYTIYQCFGYGGLKFQILYTIQGIFWLEMVNYLEHYGLRRQKDENGIHETITQVHSWSAVSSPVAFRL